MQAPQALFLPQTLRGPLAPCRLPPHHQPAVVAAALPFRQRQLLLRLLPRLRLLVLQRQLRQKRSRSSSGGRCRTPSCMVSFVLTQEFQGFD
jgi:hypothetical protein